MHILTAERIGKLDIRDVSEKSVLSRCVGRAREKIIPTLSDIDDDVFIMFG